MRVPIKEFLCTSSLGSVVVMRALHSRTALPPVTVNGWLATPSDLGIEPRILRRKGCFYVSGVISGSTRPIRIKFGRYIDNLSLQEGCIQFVSRKIAKLIHGVTKQYNINLVVTQISM